MDDHKNAQWQAGSRPPRKKHEDQPSALQVLSIGNCHLSSPFRYNVSKGTVQHL